ncbi:MAG: bacterial Ig-like domain-containing protein, partial [Acutalibacteraceae bacterium]
STGTANATAYGYSVGLADASNGADYSAINYMRLIIVTTGSASVGLNGMSCESFEGQVYGTTKTSKYYQTADDANPITPDTTEVNVVEIASDPDLADGSYSGTAATAAMATLSGTNKNGIAYPKVYTNASYLVANSSEYYVDMWFYVSDTTNLPFCVSIEAYEGLGALNRIYGSSCEYWTMSFVIGSTTTVVNDLTGATLTTGWNHLQKYITKFNRADANNYLSSNATHPTQYGIRSRSVSDTIGGITLYSHNSNAGLTIAMTEPVIANADGEYNGIGFSGSVTDMAAEKLDSDIFTTRVQDSKADLGACVVDAADLGDYAGDAQTAYFATLSAVAKSGIGVPASDYKIDFAKLSSNPGSYYYDAWLYFGDTANLKDFTVRVYSDGELGRIFSNLREESWAYSKSLTLTEDIDFFTEGTQTLQNGWNHIVMPISKFTLGTQGNGSVKFGYDVFTQVESIGGFTFHNNTAASGALDFAVSQTAIVDASGSDEWRTNGAHPISISLTGYEETLSVGDAFSAGNIAATINFDTGVTRTVGLSDSHLTVDSSEVNMADEGDYTVTVTYTDDNGNSVSATYSVSVSVAAAENVFAPVTGDRHASDMRKTLTETSNTFEVYDIADLADDTYTGSASGIYYATLNDNVAKTGYTLGGTLDASKLVYDINNTASTKYFLNMWVFVDNLDTFANANFVVRLYSEDYYRYTGSFTNFVEYWALQMGQFVTVNADGSYSYKDINHTVSGTQQVTEGWNHFVLRIDYMDHNTNTLTGVGYTDFMTNKTLGGISFGMWNATADIFSFGVADIAITDANGDTDPVTAPTVLDKTVVDTSAVKKQFAVGDELNTSGIVVTNYYDDDTTEVVDPENYVVDASAVIMDEAGTYTVTITMDDKKIGSYDVVVADKSGISIWDTSGMGPKSLADAYTTLVSQPKSYVEVVDVSTLTDGDKEYTGDAIDAYMLHYLDKTGKQGFEFAGNLNVASVDFENGGYSLAMWLYLPSDSASSFASANFVVRIFSNNYFHYQGSFSNYIEYWCYNAGQQKLSTGWNYINIPLSSLTKQSTTTSQGLNHPACIGYIDFESTKTLGGISFVDHNTASFDVALAQVQILDENGTEDWRNNVVTATGVSISGQKTSFAYGAEFEVGSEAIVTVDYDNGGSSIVTDYTVDSSEFKSLVPGTYTITITAEGWSTSYDVTVDDGITGIEVTNAPDKTTYTVGEELDYTGLVASIVYASGLKEEIEAGADCDIDASEVIISEPGTYTVYLIFENDLGEEVRDSFTVTYEAAEVTLVGIDISALPTKVDYTTGEAIDLTGLKVIAIYSDKSSAEITGYTTDALSVDTSTAGTKTVTVTYDGETATFNVTYTDSAPALTENKYEAENNELIVLS